MMSSEMNPIQTNFFDAIKTQYHFKLRAHHGMFSTMIIVQIIALFLGYNSVGSGINNVSVNSVVYSGEAIIILTIACAAIMGFRLTMKQSKNMMFSFVTDRNTNHIFSSEVRLVGKESSC